MKPLNILYCLHLCEKCERRENIIIIQFEKSIEFRIEIQLRVMTEYIYCRRC